MALDLMVILLGYMYFQWTMVFKDRTSVSRPHLNDEKLGIEPKMFSFKPTCVSTPSFACVLN